MQSSTSTTYIIQHASDEVKQELRERRKSISQVYQFLKEQEKKAVQESKTSDQVSIPEDGMQLFNADFRDEGKKIPDESIDLIFTNPTLHSDPYVELDFMKFAARVLKRGRCIVMYVDKTRIPYVIDQSRKAVLKFQWPIVKARKESPNLAFIYGRSGDYQLMLVFSKGPRDNNKEKIPDLVEPNKAVTSDRDLVDANHIINYFSKENEIVCDPFLRSGATAIAALN
jgi:DNA modification methylase